MNDQTAEAPHGVPRRVSDILAFMAAAWPNERISLGEVARALGDRGYGLLMLVLALTGMVPGVATIAAIPLTLIALQMMIGLPQPWLPRFLAARSLSRADFAAMVGRVMPYLRRVERLLQPRLTVLTGPIGERILGAVCVILALLLTVPILINLPLALPIALISLAVLERDGVFAAVGLVAGVAVVGALLGLGWISLQEGLQLAGKYLGM